MKREYDCFVDSLDELPEGQEVKIEVRDLTAGPRKYDGKYVRAIISRFSDRLQDADVLRVRFQRGWLHPDPFYMKILAEIGEYMPHELPS